MKKYPTASLALAFFGVGAIMVYFLAMTPYMTDNYVFSHDIHPGYARFYSGAKITTGPMTLEAAFRQACEMYYTWCGRFAGNLAVYLLFMLPRALYCLLAAAIFGLYLLLLEMCVFGRDWRRNLTAGWILALAALVWSAMPSFGEAFLWLSVGGQIALLGQAAMLLPFRLALDDSEARQRDSAAPALKCLLFFAGGIVVSSLDYPTSAALPPAALCCCAWLYFRREAGRRQIPILHLCGALGLVLGAVLTLCAPGNAQRMLITNDEAVHAYMAASWGERLLSWLLHLPLAMWLQLVPLILIVWSCFCLWRQHGRSWWRQAPVAALLFLVPALLTHGAYLFTAWPPPRAFATCCMQLLLCGLIFFVAAREADDAVFRRQFRTLRALLCLFCIFSLPYEAIKFYIMDQTAREREAILSTAKGSAEIPAMPVSGDRYLVLGSYLADLSVDPDFWVNRAMAAHYKLDTVKRKGAEPAFFKAVEPLPGTDGLAVKMANGHIYVGLDKPGAKAGRLHFYYPGVPGLMYRVLPRFVCQRIYKFLCGHARAGWAHCLVAMLLPRTDVKLKEDGNGKLGGISQPLKPEAVDKIWLVRPGASALSLDMLPMEKTPVKAEE